MLKVCGGQKNIQVETKVETNDGVEGKCLTKVRKNMCLRWRMRQTLTEKAGVGKSAGR